MLISRVVVEPLEEVVLVSRRRIVEGDSSTISSGVVLDDPLAVTSSFVWSLLKSQVKAVV